MTERQRAECLRTLRGKDGQPAPEAEVISSGDDDDLPF